MRAVTSMVAQRSPELARSIWQTAGVQERIGVSTFAADPASLGNWLHSSWVCLLLTNFVFDVGNGVAAGRKVLRFAD